MPEPLTESDALTPPDSDAETLPWQQALFDDVFLLLTAGLVVPTVFFIVWGLWELASVKPLP